MNVEIKNNIVSVTNTDYVSGGKFDLSDNPDLLPPLAILCLKSKNPIEIYNVKHARYKETDRISIVATQLSKTGIQITEKEDGLTLRPAQKLSGARLESSNDHRLFMAFCIVGLYVDDCTVTDAESVAVSYPNFISDIKNIGGNLDAE